MEVYQILLIIVIATVVVYFYLKKPNNILSINNIEFTKEELNLDKYDFLIKIDGVFLIKNKGTVVTGQVERGIINIGDTVNITGKNINKKTEVIGIEIFHKQIDKAKEGDNIGLFLNRINRDEVEIGNIIYK